MNPICRLALQEAAQLCVSQTNFYVEIEHFLSKLAQVERSDLGEILKAYDIKLASLSAQLTGAIEDLNAAPAARQRLRLYCQNYFKKHG